MAETVKIILEVDGKNVKVLDSAGSSLGKLNQKTKAASGGLKSFKAGWLAITAATVAATAAIGKTIKAAAFQEKQQRTLAAAMKQAGTFTQEAFKHNLEYASSLQKMTTFGDEAIIGVQKMLTNFGIEGQALDQLTKATLDLAAAKGMDLKAAADLVAKSVGSSTNALSRYGIQVEGAVGSTERIDDAVQNIARLFGGAAQAEADTLSGRFEQFKNAAGDAAETIGAVFIPFLTKLLKNITPLIGKIEAWVKSAQGLKTINDIIRGIVTGFLIIKAVIATVTNSIEILVQSVVGSANTINAFFATIKEEGIKGIGSAFKNARTESINFAEQNIKDAEDIKTAWQKSIDDIGTTIETTYVNNLNLMTDSTIQANEKMTANTQQNINRTSFSWDTFWGGQKEKSQATFQSVTQGVSSSLSFMSGSLDKSSKKQFKVWKGLSIAQAIIDTAQGAIAAYKSLATIPIVGPALGITAAATLSAFGALRIAKIKSTKFTPAAEMGAVIPGTDEGTLIRAGEKGKTEAIIPLEGEGAEIAKEAGLGGNPIIIQIENFFPDNEDSVNKLAEILDRKLFDLKRTGRSEAFA